MNEEPNSENITPQELIDSLLHDIEECREVLEMYRPVFTNIIPQLWHLNKALKSGFQATEHIHQYLFTTAQQGK